VQKTEFLAYLRCPEDHTELTFVGDELVHQVNAAIRAGRITNRGGKRLHERIDTGLVRARGDVMYPIVHGIPLLLRDEGISIEAFNSEAK
jgi:uncharacterized protein YbaR (Trm112 family)